MATPALNDPTSTIVSGVIGLRVPDPDALIAEPAAKAAFMDVVAALAGTSTSLVRVNLTRAVRRRLRSSNSGARRLPDANLNVQYSVLVPAGTSSSWSADAISGALADVKAADLANRTAAALEAHMGGSFQVQVVSVAAPTIQLPTTTTTTTVPRTSTRVVTATRTATPTSTRTRSTTTTSSTSRTSAATTTPGVGLGTEPGSTAPATSTLTTTTSTITAPPPPASVVAPPAACGDLPAFRDARGLSCQDWVGANCTAASGYSENALAEVRRRCQAACGLCTLAPPFVVQEVKKVSSELALSADLTHLDPDGQRDAIAACVAAALGLPASNIVGLQVQEDTGRRLQGGAPRYQVKYQAVVPPSRQLRDIMMQATSLATPGSPSLSTFRQAMSDGFGVDTSTMTVEVTAKPVAQPVSVVLQGDEVAGTAAPAPAPPLGNAAVGGSGGPAPAPSSGTSVVSAMCADEAQFVDEQGEPCSAWVGLDCGDPKWLRTRRPYSARGLSAVQQSCPLACGRCQPLGRLALPDLESQCIDDPPLASWCARWRGLNCSAAADLGFNPSYAALLLDRCPQSCGLCPAAAVACVDAAGFRDERGEPCSSWKGASCTTQAAGYSRKGLLEVQAACPASCGFCAPQAAQAAQAATCQDDADYTYLQHFTCRDFVGHTCTYATLYLEPRWLLGPHAVSDWHHALWAACPVACGRCEPPGRPEPRDLLLECEDDEYLAEWCATKWKGQDCSQWQNSVRLVVDGEAARYNATLLGRCPATCGLCAPPSCGDGTYRDKAAHACAACQPGRYAAGRRSGASAAACRPAEPGFSVPDAGAGTPTACDAGSFTSDPGQVSCGNCSAGSYGAYRGMSACVACAPGWYQDAEGATECLRCPEGTYASSNGTTRCEQCPLDYTTVLQASTSLDSCVCPVGTYKPYNGSGVTSRCRACPQAISCPGGHAYLNESRDDTPMLMAGAMSLPSDPFSAFLCTAPDACLWERPIPYSEADMDVVCPDLTSGPRCWDCPRNQTGAYHDDNYMCQPCDSAGGRAWKLVVFFLLQLFFTWNLYRQEGTIQSGAKLMFVSVLGFMQVLMALSQIPLDWPKDMGWLLNVLVYFGYDGVLSSLVDFRHECYFGPGLLPRVLRDACLPLLPFVNFAVIWVVYRVIGRKVAWGAAHNVTAGMFFAFFVNLAVMALQLFPTQAMPNGREFLVAFPGIEMGSKEWKRGVPISLSAIAVYCLGFIAYAAHAIVVAPAKCSDEEWMESRDWMVGEINPATHWWPMVDLSYAFGVAVVQALSPNIYFDIYLEMAVLLCYTMVLIAYQPCTIGGVNRANAALNIGLLTFMAFGTGFINTTLVDQTPNRAYFGVLLVVLLWCLFAYVAVQIARALYHVCTTTPLQENIRVAHRAHIMMKSLVLLPEAKFVRALGPEKLFDPDIEQLLGASRLLVSTFLHQQWGRRLHEQRIIKKKPFKVFSVADTRRHLSTNGAVHALCCAMEQDARVQTLASALAAHVLEPATGQSGPIVSHAARLLEEGAGGHRASSGLAGVLRRLQSGRSRILELLAAKSRGDAHKGGAAAVDEEGFVRELKEFANMQDGELREVFQYLDVNKEGHLWASHVADVLMLLGNVSRGSEGRGRGAGPRSEADSEKADKDHDCRGRDHDCLTVLDAPILQVVV